MNPALLGLSIGLWFPENFIRHSKLDSGTRTNEGFRVPNLDEGLAPLRYMLSKMVSIGNVSVGPSHSEYLHAHSRILRLAANAAAGCANGEQAG